MATHSGIVGTRVRHGSLTGVVVGATAATILIQADGEAGNVTVVKIPEHLR